MSVPPAAPTDFAAYLTALPALTHLGLREWRRASSRFVLYSRHHARWPDVVAHPVAACGTQPVVPSVDSGNYYLRVAARNGTALSPASNEATFEMPAGGGCSAPPARGHATVFGRYVQPQLAGRARRGSLSAEFHRHVSRRVAPSPGNVGPVTVPGAPLGVYDGDMTTTSRAARRPSDRTPGHHRRRAATGTAHAEPAAGQRLPLPNRLNVVNAVAARFPNELRHSCPTEHRGDTNRFLFELVRELRKEDNRWGLNWKRGNRGDMSQDIVTYNYGSESDEDTTHVYIVDIMFGHCGPSPGPAWIDQTEATARGHDWPLDAAALPRCGLSARRRPGYRNSLSSKLDRQAGAGFTVNQPPFVRIGNWPRQTPRHR